MSVADQWAVSAATWWSQHRWQNGDSWSHLGWHHVGDRKKSFRFVAEPIAWIDNDDDVISTAADAGTRGTVATEPPRYRHCRQYIVAKKPPIPKSTPSADALLPDRISWQFSQTDARGSAASLHYQSNPAVEADASHQAATVGACRDLYLHTYLDGLRLANAVLPPAAGDWLTFKYPAGRGKNGFRHKFYTNFPSGKQVPASQIHVDLLFSSFQVLEVRSGWKETQTKNHRWSTSFYIAVRFNPFPWSHLKDPCYLWTNFSQDRHIWCRLAMLRTNFSQD